MFQTAEGSIDDRALVTFSTLSDSFPDGVNEQMLTLNIPHRLAYLTFEGPVSSGRGRVKRMDRGEILKFFEKKHHVQFILEVEGDLLKGCYEIVLKSPDRYVIKKMP